MQPLIQSGTLSVSTPVQLIRFWHLRTGLKLNCLNVAACNCFGAIAALQISLANWHVGHVTNLFAWYCIVFISTSWIRYDIKTSIKRLDAQPTDGEPVRPDTLEIFPRRLSDRVRTQEYGLVPVFKNIPRLVSQLVSGPRLVSQLRDVYSDTTQLNWTQLTQMNSVQPSQSCFCLWRHDLQTESTVVHAVELSSVELCRYKRAFIVSGVRVKGCL